MKTALMGITRSWRGVPVLVGLVVLIVLLWALGALTVLVFPGLASTPEITVWLLPVARFARDLAAVVTVGGVIVGGLLVVDASNVRLPPRRALRWASWWALGWFVSLVLLLGFTISDVLAMTPLEALAPSTVWPFLVDVSVGRVFATQLVAVAIVGACAWWVTSRRVIWFLALLVVSASAAPAFLGHSGLEHSHASATTSLGIHIAAVSIWIGGLIVVVALVRAEPGLATGLLPRFSLLALWCVIIVAESGLLNASLRVGTPAAFLGTAYGSLVLVKAVILGFLIRLGWLQRRRAIPALSAPSDLQTAPLLRYASWEFIGMAVAVAVSVVLSRIGPAPVAVGGPVVAPIALVCLALAAPLLVVWSTSAAETGWRKWARSYPEVPAVALIIAVVQIDGLGALTGLLGEQWGAVVGAIILLLLGYIWAVSVGGERRLTGIVIMMAGWPLALWFTGNLDSPMSIVALVIAEALILSTCLRYSGVRYPGVRYSGGRSS